MMTTPFDCPRCGTVLTMSDRQGIEIDYCPQCRGVWLDRGELDKILERAASMSGSAAAGVASGAPPGNMQAGGWARPATDYQPAPNYAPAPPYPTAAPYAGKRDRDDDDWDNDRKSYGQPRGYQGKSRKNWLSELFD